MSRTIFFLVCAVLFSFGVAAQERETAGPITIDSARAVESSSLAKRKLIPPSGKYKVYNPKKRGLNAVVPGKGLPFEKDQTRQDEFGKFPAKAPLLSLDVVRSRSTPTDPTGAVGPNHYVNAWNSEFSIYDKSGNQLIPPASLASFGGEFSQELDGDPIVLYDEAADRFLIMQFSDTEEDGSPTPAGLLIAVSQGSDPVNDGWYTYRFNTISLPDYPKISVWGDGYYITTNKNALSPQGEEIIFVLERGEMLQGETAQVISFPLPGIRNNGFYSPAAFSAVGEAAPSGNLPIVYLQDDAWRGVNEDHLKLWLANVNWDSPDDSTISEAQELGASEGVSPFIATFDGGGFENLEQPGDAPDVDALQAAMMYMTQFRRFDGYNSAVMNFVVDIDPSPAEHAGVRWYELRQQGDDAPWEVYQEGTYAPDRSDRFCGSIGIDIHGNIGLGFTVLDDSPSNPIYPSIRYTGRYENDPLGQMTIVEETIVEGNSPNPHERYGDYAHLTVDPLDGESFWHNAEYFEGVWRLNRLGVFKLAPDFGNDLGVVAVSAPRDALLGEDEEITVTIRNFGSNAQSNFPVTFSVDGGESVTEIFTGSLPGTSSAQFTFSETADFSEMGQTYTITATTELDIDQYNDNDSFTEDVTHLPPVDVGVTSIDSPETNEDLGEEEVTVTIENFGGEAQSNIPVSYQIGNNTRINEIFEGEIEVGEYEVYSFSQPADLSVFGRYNITASTHMEDDAVPTNNSTRESVANLDCTPEGSDCSFGDGIFYFELEDILNERIPCGDGYADFIGVSTDLDRQEENFVISAQTYYSAEEDEERLSMWIDLNDNGVFEEDERLLTDEVLATANTPHNFEFSLPEDAPLGQHLLRVRAGDTSFDGDLNDPCDVMDYGTTHDYSVNIIDSSLSIEDFLLNDANLIIVDEGGQHFRAIMETNYEDSLRITVHNMLGQKLLENEMLNQGDGYVYDLDMSYAATGVYLVRVGTRNVGKVQRIIVR